MVALSIAIVIAWLAFLRPHRLAPSAPQPSASAPVAQQQPSPAAPSPPARTIEPTAAAPASVLPAVVHQQLPNVSAKALATIHGTLHVTVRVRVDATGKVFAESLEDPGPSAYFARKSLEAARQWRFAAAPRQPNRYWLLRFEFTRAGSSVTASSPWS